MILSDIQNLPNTPVILKGIIAEQLLKNSDLLSENSELRTCLEEKESAFNRLWEQIRLLKQQAYGRKSEKMSSEGQQLLAGFSELFNEAEHILNTAPAEEEKSSDAPPKHRTNGGRKRFPAGLPRIIKVCDISPEEKICACGAEKFRIGEETSERLDIIPAKVQVIETIRPKYACPNCQGVEEEGGAVVIAPVPEHIVPKSMLSAGFIAYAITAKFQDGLPFYRQEQIFKRLDEEVQITRATLSSVTIKTAERCMPIMEILTEDLLQEFYIGIDETRVQVMKEAGRANTTESYMWVFKGGTPEKPVIIFNYRETRSGKFLPDFLSGFEGYVQSDGFCGYDVLDKSPRIKLLACWAHARRKFHDVTKVHKDEHKEKGRGIAVTILKHVKYLYLVESDAKDRKLTAEERLKLRQEKSVPVLGEIKDLMDKVSPAVPPRSLLGKAMNYCLERWEKLLRYTTDGRLNIDNNPVENAIRPFVIGRKNWLFSGSPCGAKASAIMYSLIETAKANNLEPYSYLRYIFEKIPLAKEKADFQKLLPYELTQEKITQFFSEGDGIKTVT